MTWLAPFAALVLTPVIMRALARAFPARPAQLAEYYSLRRRYRRLEVWSQLAAVAGLVGSIWIVIVLGVGNTPWIIGVGLGWLVLTPILVIALFTLPRGVERWRHFWRFYELTCHISLRFLAPVYAAFCVV